MKKNPKALRQGMRRAVPLILTVAWLVFMFANSMQTGEESGEQSKSALAWVLGLFSSLGLPISISELFLRKLAHFSEYALLGVLFSLDLWGFGLLARAKSKSRLLLTCLSAIPCCTLCALIDEFVIQRLTPGRGPSILDVLIDTAGAVTAALLVFGIVLLVRHARKKKHTTTCKTEKNML